MTKQQAEQKYGVKYEFLSYPLDVLEGRILACNTIKQVCQRYLDWLLRDDLYFDEDKADKPIRFVRHLKHTEKPFTGKPFEMLPWQKFVCHYTFGFINKSTGYRQIRTLYLQVSRKNGKSGLASALCLYGLMGDGETGAEIYFIAPTRSQAQQDMKYTSQFVRGINKSNILKINRNEIRFAHKSSMLKVLSGDANKYGDGYNPHFALLDETHCYSDSSLVDIMTSGMTMRTQPLTIQITTAGFDLYGYCYPYYEMCKRVLSKEMTDDTLLPIIYELDDPDTEWTNPKMWKKASPSLGETVRIEAVEAEYQKALNLKSQEVNFKTKYLNIWCQSENLWIDVYKYLKPKMRPIDMNEFRGKNVTCWVGFDLACTQDLNAITAMIHDEDEDKFYFKTYYLLPEDTINGNGNPNAPLYRKWVEEGHLLPMEGNVLDDHYVADIIYDIDQNYGFQISRILYDSWNARSLIIQLANAGLESILTPMSQSVGNFSRYTKEMEKMILSDDDRSSMIVDYNPITLWCFQNAELQEDIHQNVKPKKSSKNRSKKIDGVISMIQAFAGYLYEVQPTANLEAI